VNAHPEPSAWASLDTRDRRERRALLAHAARCAACRGQLVAGDPAKIFALLAAHPMPEEILEEVSAGVRGAPSRAPRTGLRAAAAWAAAAVLVGALALVLREPGTALGPPPDVAALAVPAGGLRLLRPPSAARVVDLTVGQTQVVMIFDEGLDL